ncbi:Ufm1-specific protease 2 [Blomia tropicalis]|nr:Ufm1-specific protease 2 [Blomia tropicalis]
MSGKTFNIVNTLESRLKYGAKNTKDASFPTSGIVFGFNITGPNNESFCMGSVSNENDIPFGQTMLGAFFAGDSFDNERIIDYCSSLAKNKKSGKFVVLQYDNSEQEKLSCYDIKSKTLVEGKFQTVDYNLALNNLVTISLSSTFRFKCNYYKEKFIDDLESYLQETNESLSSATFPLNDSGIEISDETEGLMVEDLYNQIEQFEELADVQIPANMKKKMIEKLQRKLRTNRELLEFTFEVEESKIESNGDSIQNDVASIADSNVLPIPQVFSFYDASTYTHPITAIFVNINDDKLFQTQRKEIHQKYIIPMDKPAFKTNMQFGAKSNTDNCLLNVHVGLNSGIKNGTPVTVEGKYLYYHYNQQHMNDSGWGCAYRSLQTIISWFQLHGYINIDRAPSHKQIQEALVEVGDKPANFVGSNKWIGSQEVFCVLNHLYGIESKIIFINSGAELANKARELIQHFQNNGTPIMIGGGVLAHTIIGVHFDESNGNVKYLVLDPHFTGEDDISVIHKKGWVGWKEVSFWDAHSFYNLCLPQKPVTY